MNKVSAPVMNNGGPRNGNGKARRKKICMIAYLPTPTYLPPMFNGAQTLVQKGYDVEILCITSDPDIPRFEKIQNGLIARWLFLRSMKMFNDLYGLSPRNNWKAAIQYVATYFEFNLKAVISAFRSNADLYEAHDLPTLPPAFIASALRRKPLAYHAHELYAEMHEKVRFAGWWKFLERLLVPYAQVVVTPEKNRSQIMLVENGAKTLPLTVRNCPPYTLPVVSNKLKEELAERNIFPGTIVLYQGLFDNSRCMHEMIRSAKYFNEGTFLVLIGSGFQEWKFPEKFIGDSKNIVVLPRVEYSELSLYTASADIGMLFYRNNCRNNYYCAPNKVHEYMMMGLPVVTNNYPGISALVDGEGIGTSVDSDQPLQIAAAINAMTSDHQKFKLMKHECLALSKNKYNWEKEYKKLLDRYYDLLWPERIRKTVTQANGDQKQYSEQEPALLHEADIRTPGI